MIFVISKWKKKLMYIIFAAVIILAVSVLFISGNQETVNTENNVDCGVEKVAIDNSNELETEEIEKPKEDPGWLKSLINKFKKEE